MSRRKSRFHQWSRVSPKCSAECATSPLNSLPMTREAYSRAQKLSLDERPDERDGEHRHEHGDQGSEADADRGPSRCGFSASTDVRVQQILLTLLDDGA